MTAATETAVQCSCMPGAVCGSCSARGYVSGLAGYAARIYPRLVTAADEARDQGVHYVAPDDDECRAFDRCANCGAPVQADYLTGQLGTMVGRNFECYGRRP